MKYLVILMVGIFIHVLSAEPVMTGKSIIESEKAIPYSVPITEGKFLLEREMLQNPGFETGSLYPWTTNYWIVDTTYPHQGRFCASTVGNNWIRQDIRPMPAGYITHVTFWARQPEAPAAQAYDFIYSDSTFDEFVHFPTSDWAQYDVTANLNRQKWLVAFRLWGYSGGGPNPDSTYIDDVSIIRAIDVGITAILSPAGDTFQLNDTIRPAILLENWGPFTESLWVWCRIEHTCSTHIYNDSTLRILQVGEQGTVYFNRWTPMYTGQHRFRFSFSPYDTTPWGYFWVVEGSAIKENYDFSIGNEVIVRPTIGKSFEFICADEHKLPNALKIYNSSGELVWTKKITAQKPVTIKWFGTDQLSRGLSSGVYLARFGNITKRIVLTE